MMTTFSWIRPVSPSGLLRNSDVERVATTLRNGGLAVLPTETGYMLASLATDLDAVSRAFVAKGRDTANPMHIACASLTMAGEFAHISTVGRALIAEFTPGPLTVVLRQRDTLPDRLVTLDGTVGIRIPDSPATLQVIAAVGAPVTATSVNRSGEESSGLDQETLDELDWGGLPDVPVVVHAGSITYLSPSTLVRVTGAEPEVLRPGPVTPADIERVLTRDGAGGAAQGLVGV